MFVMRKKKTNPIERGLKVKTLACGLGRSCTGCHEFLAVSAVAWHDFLAVAKKPEQALSDVPDVTQTFT